MHRVPADPRRGLRPRPAGPRRSVAGPAGRTRTSTRRHRDLERAGPLRPPSRPRRSPRPARRPPGRTAGGRVHRLGRRAEHQARPGRADHRHRPDRGAARVHGRPRPHRHRRRAEPVGDRGPAGWAGAAARRAFPAVRVPADPQRGHARRQPRHRLADRRRPAGPAGAGRLAGAGLEPRRARGRAGRLLHRLPAERQAPRRADQDHSHPAARRPGHRVPQDRQAPVRRHLERRHRVRAPAGGRRRRGECWQDR